MGGPSKGRATVGVLLDWFKDSYQGAVLAGLSDAARREDANLAIFSGGVLGAPASDGLYRNFAFDACGPRSVDGVVALAGALGNQLGPAAIADLLARWGPMPFASVALAMPGVPSLLLDEERGMRQALEHVVVRHGCRRVAFIRGPSVNAEAERRYALYLTVLEEHGLAHDPALVCEGTFHESAGEAAVRTLIDVRKVDFDAVVASNDYMALAAMAALQERGVHIPSDVAVIGFDDLEDARYASPPLTTVRQPLHQQGEAALGLVLAQLGGQQVPMQTVAATELIIRQSCGCFTGGARPGRAAPVTRTSTGIDSLLAEHADALRDQMVHAVHGAAALLGAGWDRQLLSAFESELRAGAAGLFSNTLDRLLTDRVSAGDDVASWQGLISTMRRLLLPALENEPFRRLTAEDVWHEARILICDLAERAQAKQRLQTERVFRALNESTVGLLGAPDLASLVRAVVQLLPRLGIPGAWLALFEGEARPATSARLALAYDETAAPALSGELRFPTTELLPADVWPTSRRTSLVVEPLFFRERPLGYVVLEMGPRDGIVYESLAAQLSGALHSLR